MLLTICTCIYTSFDKTINKYLPHEAQNQEHAKNYQIVKACKLNRSLEIVTKPYELFSKSPNMVVFPPNFLDSGASNVCPSSPCIHHQGTNPLTSYESPHLHQTQEVRILVPIFFWVHGG